MIFRGQSAATRYGAFSMLNLRPHQSVGQATRARAGPVQPERGGRRLGVAEIALKIAVSAGKVTARNTSGTW